MPDEATIIKQLSEHYPSLLMALSVICATVYATLRANKHFVRLETLEKELVRLKADWVDVKSTLARIVLTHCKRHPDDMDRLMAADEKQEEKRTDGES